MTKFFRRENAVVILADLRFLDCPEGFQAPRELLGVDAAREAANEHLGEIPRL